MKANVGPDTESKNGSALSSLPGCNEWQMLGVLLLVTFVYRFYCIRFFDVMSADGTGYALNGKEFFATGDFKSFGTLQPPLYPFFVGLFDLVFHDLEKAARTVSVVFSALTIVPIYLMAREFYGKTAAFCATLLFMTLPFIHGMSGVDITEPTYTFFAFAGSLVFWKAFTGKNPVFFILAGMLLGLAYLARPEGFIVSLVMGVFFIGMGFYVFGAMKGLRKSTLFTGLFWCGFLVMTLPYMAYLHGTTGKWQLSGKTGLNSNIIREYRGQVQGDQHLRLDAQGNLVGGGDATLLDIARKEPDLFWGNIRENLRTLPREFGATFPAYLWPFVLIGLFAYPWRSEHVGIRLLLFSMCAPLALYVLYFIQARGFFAYVPVLLVVAGGGSGKVADWLQHISPRPVGRPAVLLVVGLLAAYFVYNEWPRPKPPYDYTQDGGRYDDKQIGMRLRTLLPEKAVIMTRSGRIGFYSQRKFDLPPQGSLEEIIAYGRKHGISYLIATIQLLNMRPQLESLYGPLINPGGQFTPPPGLELVHLGQEPGGLPYLVYRFH